MAEFEPAVAITLRNEGGFLHNPATGEIVNHGVTLKFVRESGYRPDAGEDFIRNLTTAEATSIYRIYFWDRYRLGEIVDQPLAGKAFDLTVNMGPVALRLLQSAVDRCGGQCAVDGVLGPLSLAQINALDASALLAEFKKQAAGRYREIAADNPKLAGDLPVWLARLDT